MSIEPDACRAYNLSCPDLIRASINLRKSMFFEGWIAGSSPAMTNKTSNARQIDVVRCTIDKRIEGAMNELDFGGKQVLVVGGSSGIGNGIAQAFCARGARVAACGTRASPADYSPAQGSQLEGPDYAQLDVGDPAAIENFKPVFESLDVLVLAQGAVIYKRGEFEMAGFRKVLEVNLMSL